jgi:integrase
MSLDVIGKIGITESHVSPDFDSTDFATSPQLANHPGAHAEISGCTRPVIKSRCGFANRMASPFNLSRHSHPSFPDGLEDPTSPGGIKLVDFLDGCFLSPPTIYECFQYRSSQDRTWLLGAILARMTGRRHFGSVRKRSSGRWQASYFHLGTRHHAPETFRTKADGLAWLSGVEVEIRRGGWVDPRGGMELFSTIAKSWLDSRPDLRPRSVLVYQSQLKCHLLPAFGHMPIAEISPSQVRTWYAKLVSEKPGTAPAAYRLLRAIFNSAVHDELLVRSPCRVSKGGADRAVERTVPTIAEVQALSDEMPESLRVAVTLAAWGALRRGEILALRRKDIDLLRSSVRVERAQVELSNGTVLFSDPKTDAGIRTVHLPAHAMQAVDQHLADYVAGDPNALLLTGRGGVPLRPKTLGTAFANARSACGLSTTRFHDLRHFSMTMASTTGASTKELMRRAGHSSPAAALRYQHATEDRDKAIANALDQMVRGDVVPISTAKTRNPSRPQRAQGDVG